MAVEWLVVAQLQIRTPLISSRNIFLEINLKFRKKGKYHHKLVSASSAGRYS